MTYRDFYEQLIKKYADEKGIIRGKACSLLYRVSRAGETYGFDSLVDDELLAEIVNKGYTTKIARKTIAISHP